MKKSFTILLFLSVIIGLLFTACVSGKKFTASEARVDKLQKDYTKTQNQLNVCYGQVQNLNNEKASMLNDYVSIQKDLNALSNETKMTIAEQARRLKILQDLIQSQRDVMNKLKVSIADALMDYKTDELNVYNKEGNVYVSLEEKLLFKSGSDVVDPKGVQALKSLAAVLNNTNEINVVIEGHTDNVPIKTKQFKDNWDLSTGRATSILRVLTDGYGFDPNRITASGKGQFHPVKTNETDDGRAGNRRTEIILSPDLKEIYKILYQ
jgi:chemotaxis protein MotB